MWIRFINYDIASHDESSSDMDCLMAEMKRAYCAWNNWQLQGSNSICSQLYCCKGTSDLYNLLYKVVFYCWYFSFVVMHLTLSLINMGT